MLQEGSDNGLPEENEAELRQMLTSNVDVFQTSLSSGPPAKADPLHIKLTPKTKLSRGRLRIYSKEKSQFFLQLVKLLMSAGMAYFNPSAVSVFASLLAPKDGNSLFRFIVDQRLGNRLTVAHHFPIQNLKHKLPKNFTSRQLAMFDLSHEYWQRPLSKSSQEC